MIFSLARRALGLNPRLRAPHALTRLLHTGAPQAEQDAAQQADLDALRLLRKSLATLYLAPTAAAPTKPNDVTPVPTVSFTAALHDCSTHPAPKPGGPADPGLLPNLTFEGAIAARTLQIK